MDGWIFGTKESFLVLNKGFESLMPLKSIVSPDTVLTTADLITLVSCAVVENEFQLSVCDAMCAITLDFSGHAN